MGIKISASFRDPSGFVYSQGGKILRQVNLIYKEDFDFMISSGLIEMLAEKKLLIPHQVADAVPLIPELSYQIIQPEQINFISYPYEWSFSQLKDAALLTLTIQQEAFKVGMTLKDASAYNIQFHQGSPILIDTLSFARYVEGIPWVAYRQFCQHFLAPLALMSKTDIRLNNLLVNYIDGIPLDLCSRLLPQSSWFDFGLLSHIHLHARAQSHYGNSSRSDKVHNSNQKSRLTKTGLINLINNLETTIKHLSPKITDRRWAEYYSDTNYTEEAFGAKKAIIRDLLQTLKPKLVLDLGANTGVFSREAANLKDCFVVSADSDPEVVEINYQQVKKENQKNILPLIIDLTNPSPAIGWKNQERDSFFSRGKADVILALALIHHLAIGNNVPLEDIASMMANLSEHLILEFVPKEDSQVKRLLQSRADIFDDYNFQGLIKSFEHYFEMEKKIPVQGSQRTILLFRCKSS